MLVFKEYFDDGVQRRDGLGRIVARIEEEDSDGDGDFDRRLRYEYDYYARGWLKSVTVRDLLASGAPEIASRAYEYDVQGNRTAVLRSDPACPVEVADDDQPTPPASRHDAPSPLPARGDGARPRSRPSALQEPRSVVKLAQHLVEIAENLALGRRSPRHVLVVHTDEQRRLPAQLLLPLASHAPLPQLSATLSARARATLPPQESLSTVSH